MMKVSASIFLILSTILVTPAWAQDDSAKSADDIARELANPNTPLATLNFKNQIRWYEGDLPGADDEVGYTMLFQPSLPFPLKSGKLIFFRPAIPVLIGQPVFDVRDGDFDSKFGLGDITFDLAYGGNTKNGFMWATGLVSTIPTATSSELAGGKWTLGPELLLAKMSKKYVIGAFPNHQWDIAGWTDGSVNLTTSQFFLTYLPKGGWNVGSSPIVSYDWNSEEWTVPLNLTIGKTIIKGGRPWKLSVELNYFVEKPDAFGPEWFLGINIAPVVKNPFTKWFE
jgi:hypothetical protein